MEVLPFLVKSENKITGGGGGPLDLFLKANTQPLLYIIYNDPTIV